MGLGRRLLRVLGAEEDTPADPDALVDAVVVPLPEGPVLVAGLQDRGIHAVGLESFNVITDTRSQMRVMVRRADLAAATEALERLRYGGSEELGAGPPDPTDSGDDEAAQAAMGELFLVVDRLSRAPWDVEVLDQVERLPEVMAGTGPAFGVEPSAWDEMAAACAGIVDADEGDEEVVRARALALRSYLREYV